MDIKKIIYSILKEIQNGEREPQASDYDLTNEQFADIAKIISDENYADNISIAKAGEKSIVWLNSAKITMKGIEFLNQNSVWAKTYRGLKEIRDWL